jgi:hypothetical protein
VLTSLVLLCLQVWSSCAYKVGVIVLTSLVFEMPVFIINVLLKGYFELSIRNVECLLPTL